MRSQALFRRSKLLLKASSALHGRTAPIHLLRSPHKQQQQPRLSRRISTKRLSSSIAPPTPSDSSVPPLEPPGTSDDGASNGSDPSADGLERSNLKPRRARVAVAPTKDLEPIQLPEDLDILWTPGLEDLESDALHKSALPPPQIFEEALNNLLITLHPQTQHRATYSSSSGPPVEPTLGFYCPIEGGEYIIDATVRELARQTGSEVLVLDATQLAAGEWGQFGAAANSLSLPRNPLHFPSSPSVQSSRVLPIEESDEVDTSSPLFSQPQQMTLAVMTPPTLQGRTILASSSRRNSPPSKIKVFFDTLINTPSRPEDPPSQSSSRSKPRLIYIRDFPTLAPFSSSWYPTLLSAVRERRRGPISRSSSPVNNPMAIIFGMTPPLTPPTPQSSPSGGLMSVLMSRSSASKGTNERKVGKSDWGESEAAETAREKRLRDRLKKWEKGDTALHDEFHKLSTGNERESNDDKPDIIVIGGGNGIPGFPPMIKAGAPSGEIPESDDSSSFFRTSILIPNSRSVNDEKAVRIARRREINELTLRMGIGAVGGTLEQKSAKALHFNSPSSEQDNSIGDSSLGNDATQMWKEWGNHIEVWSNVRRVADRAIGNTLSAGKIAGNLEKATLDPTFVPWSAVHKAWMTDWSSRNSRKSWIKSVSPLSKAVQEHDEDDPTIEDEVQGKVDEVVEKVKNESDLDSHEQRLLSCIVDSASMPTSFSQVHLPPHTIDSVRTIVSLPLLHPEAFQQGILKEHSMTGCLLFGPPGTGKTLVVRALAKEAGCRMMAISPSDVMDMYVGEGEKLVKAVFSLARRLAPCVVFLDEIDALFGARMSARESGGAFAHRGVITEFMQEMDGLKSSKEDNVVVIGATNRPFDLDDAVLRRLPRRLLVDLPGQKEREEILKILLRDEVLADDLNIEIMASKTENFSGSDLKHLCVSAALDAVKETVTLPWSIAPDPKVVSSIFPAANNHTPSVHSNVSGAREADRVPIEASIPSPPGTESFPRVLRLHNFTKALKEITPSSSEALGSLSELRKWNDEFGEGQGNRKRQQVWGKGRFGFTNGTDQGRNDSRVLPSSDRPVV